MGVRGTLVHSAFHLLCLLRDFIWNKEAQYTRGEEAGGQENKGQHSQLVLLAIIINKGGAELGAMEAETRSQKTMQLMGEKARQDETQAHESHAIHMWWWRQKIHGKTAKLCMTHKHLRPCVARQ